MSRWRRVSDRSWTAHDAFHWTLSFAGAVRHRPNRGVKRRLISTAVPTIPFHVPDRVDDIDGFLDDVRTILGSGRLSLGPYVERLETGLAPWVGDGHVTAVSNCSDGLIAALWSIRDP